MTTVTLLDYVGWMPAFALVLARLAGLAVAAPIFSSASIPRLAKVYLIVAMGLAVFPGVTPALPSGLTLSQALAGLFGEFALGAALGLAVNLIVLATDVAGAIAGQQAGLAFGQMVDPLSGGEGSVLGQVYFILAALVFLGIGGERELVRTLLDSFRVVPLTAYRPEGDTVELLFGALAASFVLAVQLAAPAIIALLLTAVAIGFLARTVPQLNVLSIGFSVKIVVAIVVLMGSLPMAASMLEGGLAEVFAAVRGGWARLAAGS